MELVEWTCCYLKSEVDGAARSSQRPLPQTRSGLVASTPALHTVYITDYVMRLMFRLFNNEMRMRSKC